METFAHVRGPSDSACAPFVASCSCFSSLAIVALLQEREPQLTDCCVLVTESIALWCGSNHVLRRTYPMASQRAEVFAGLYAIVYEDARHTSYTLLVCHVLPSARSQLQSAEHPRLILTPGSNIVCVTVRFGVRSTTVFQRRPRNCVYFSTRALAGDTFVAIPFAGRTAPVKRIAVSARGHAPVSFSPQMICIHAGIAAFDPTGFALDRSLLVRLRGHRESIHSVHHDFQMLKVFDTI